MRPTCSSNSPTTRSEWCCIRRHPRGNSSGGAVAGTGGGALHSPATAMTTKKGFDDSTVTDDLALNFHLMHPGEGQRARRPQRGLLPGRRLSPALHRAPPLEGWNRAAARPRYVVLFHPRDQSRHAALDLADHQAATELQRSRNLQRNRLHYQGGQAGGNVPRPVRPGTHLRHGGRGQPAQPLEQALPGPARRGAGGPSRWSWPATPTCFRSATPTTPTPPATTWSWSSPPTWSTGTTSGPSCNMTCPTSRSARTPPAPTCSRSATSGCCCASATR